MSYYTGSEISPKEFWKIRDRDIKNRLINEYAWQFNVNNRFKNNIEQIFETVFGKEWYTKPYSKLNALAKMAGEKSNGEGLTYRDIRSRKSKSISKGDV